jgi:hypothetical protein
MPGRSSANPIGYVEVDVTDITSGIRRMYGDKRGVGVPHPAPLTGLMVSHGFLLGRKPNVPSVDRVATDQIIRPRHRIADGTGFSGVREHQTGVESREAV